MKRKKLVSVMLVVLMVATLLLGCRKESDKAGSGENDSKISSDGTKIALLCVGNLGDKGFNDSAAAGLEKMEKEKGAEVKIVELGRDETSYEGNFYDVSEQDYDLIISGTWSVKELLENMAVEYPDNQDRKSVV